MAAQVAKLLSCDLTVHAWAMPTCSYGAMELKVRPLVVAAGCSTMIQATTAVCLQRCTELSFQSSVTLQSASPCTAFC